MRLRIFSCHHVAPEFQLDTPLYSTLVTGLRQAPGGRILSDLDGRNISGHPNFSELRHQFYVWQNLLAQYDYVGFEHYRRPFFIDPWTRQAPPDILGLRHDFAKNRWIAEIPIGHARFQRYNALRRDFGADELARINAHVADHDILFAYPLFDTLLRNFKVNNQDAEPIWHEFVAMAQAAWPGHFAGKYFDPPAPWSAYRNMYVMRADLFDEYMSLLFDILLPIDAKYPNAPPRLWGYLSELLCGSFIMQKTLENPLLRTRMLPYLFYDGSA